MSVSVLRAKRLDVVGSPARSAAVDFRILSLTAAPRRRLRRLPLLTAMLLGTTALVAVPASPALAQSVWDGSASADWDTPANWDTNAVPTNADNVTIDDVSVNAPVVGSGVAANVNHFYIGDVGTGSLTITGTGDLDVDGDFYIGNDGTGSILVQNGGSLTSGHGTLGGNVAGDGEVTVTGAGSSWFATGMSVGYEGAGSLTVSDGGEVFGEVWIGDNTGSGTVLVTGAGSSWTSTGEFSVGGVGTGDLTIADGATVESIDALLGWGGTGSGTALVTGAGSVWHASGSFTIGLDGEGSVTIADGGAVSFVGGTVVVASGAGSTGALNIGDGGAAGSLSANWLEFGAGAGSLNFNHTDDDYDFTTGIVGAGAINHIAGVTTLSGNGLFYSGTTTVSGGTLNVNNVFGGFWDVLSGGTLGGTGAAGDVSVASGGIVAPGNSIGTLEVVGDVTFDAGSFFDVEVDAAGNEDLLLVGNAATINGGTVRVLPEAGSYAASTIYTILTANAVTGAFDAVTSNFAFLTPSLTYDAQNVFLTLDLTAAFQDVALTPNQFNTAGAAEDLGAGNAIYDEILTMTAEEAQAAFDALSGELHASGKAAAFHSAQQIREALLARLRALSGGGAQTAGIGFVPAAGDTAPGRGTLWGQLFGALGETDGDGNAAALDRSSAGFLGGIDKSVGAASRIGVALGYSRSDFDVDARASSGESDNFHAAAYAGTKLGPVDLAATVAYSFQRADTARTVIVGGLTNNLTADYDAQVVQAAIEAGTDIVRGGIVLTPFAGLAVVNTDVDGFTEAGGPAALTVAGTSDTTGVSTLGLRARRESESFALSGALAWRHAFGDVDPASRAAFASAPAATFAVRGTPISENALALDAAVDAKLGAGTTLTFGYAGEYASGARDHGLRAELRIEF